MKINLVLFLIAVVVLIQAESACNKTEADCEIECINRGGGGHCHRGLFYDTCQCNQPRTQCLSDEECEEECANRGGGNCHQGWFLRICVCRKQHS